MMGSSRSGRTASHVLVLCILGSATAAFLACSENRNTPLGITADTTLTPPSEPLPPPGLVVSESGSGSASVDSASVLGSGETTGAVAVAYVSALPGTFPGAITVQIRNRTTGDTPTPQIAVSDGGFDPVAVSASEGDELELAILQPDGKVTFVHLTVPHRVPPVVVRTSPPKGRTDIALNAMPVVVFSEPIDPATLTLTSVQLLRGGTPVAGTVRLEEDGFTAQFTPGAPLEPSTTYELVVTREILDLDGDPLEAEVRVDFTTDAIQSSGVGTLVVSNVTTGGAFDIDGYQLFVDGTPGYRLLELNDTLMLLNLPAREWTVELDHLSGNCSVNEGARRTVTIPSGGAAQLAFDVVCTPPPELAGVRLVFSTGDYRAGTAHLFSMNADGSQLRQLTDGPVYDVGPAVSPDGSRIAFTRDRRYDGGPLLPLGIYLVNPDGSNLTHLTEGTLSPYDLAWSPDGEMIAFNTYTRDWIGWGGDIWVVRPDGSDLIRLATGDNRRPRWSPDGGRIAFNRRVDGGSSGADYGIWIMGTDDRESAPLRSPGYYPIWSPDGSRIAFSNNDVYVMNADGSSGLLLATRLVPENGWEHWSTDAWSRDGKLIALTRYNHRGYSTDIYLLYVEDHGLIRVTADGTSMWAAFLP